jgi:hypothetical protein
MGEPGESGGPRESAGGPSEPGAGGGEVIDAEYVDVDENKDNK